MKKLFSAVLILTGFVFGASAQKAFDAENFSAIKSDYEQVRAVAHLRVKSVLPVEDKGYITYAVDGEILESFKGEFKRGQPLKFYFVAEVGYDVKWYPKRLIVFLEGRQPIKSASAEKGWFELENSHREPSAENISIMRRIKSGRKKSGGKTASAENFARKDGKTSTQAVPANTPKANKSAANTGQSKTSLQTASFKGVSFKYNPQIFGEAVWQEVAEQRLEQETDEPDNVHPRHISFTFSKRNRGTGYSIAILPIDDYRRIWKNAGKGTAEAFEERLSAVGKAVKDKSYRENGEIPYLPFYDASEMFVARAKNLSFRNGEGVFFLTQFTQEFGNLVNNDELSLTYQGISKDGKYYVLADFPVTLPFLPNRDANEFEGYKALRTDEEVKKGEKSYRQYLAKMTARLENFSPDEFQPGLRYFEEIISTLKIENTEK